MISATEAKQFTKAFEPSQEHIKSIEAQIKRGERHITVFTTFYTNSYKYDLVQYCKKHGYENARIVDIYNNRTGQKGGNYLQIDL